MMETEQELVYHSVCSLIPKAIKSSMFGVPCYKVLRKPFIMFYDNEIVCKLFDDEHTNAMQLKGAKLFNPMDNEKPMTNWVHIPYAFRNEWIIFAKKAFDFVTNETKIN
jgi:hypothetical protein